MWVIKKLLGWVLGWVVIEKIGRRVHDAGPALAQQHRKAGGGAAIVGMERGSSRIGVKEVERKLEQRLHPTTATSVLCAPDDETFVHHSGIGDHMHQMCAEAPIQRSCAFFCNDER